MTDTIAVVKVAYAQEDAYMDGYREFSGLGGEETEGFDFAPFTDSARWANHVLPSLRAAAGYADGGHGTYQIHRDVAAIEPGCEDDEPADATLTEAHYIFHELVDLYQSGAYDAVDGREPDVERHC